MIMSKGCTVLIPARTGSKRVPNKNFKPLHPDGRCAVQMAIDCALLAGCRNIVVSTDQPPPFLAAVRWNRRPAELAEDDTPMIEVVEYLVKWFPASAYLLLQPTQPLRIPSHLRKAVYLLERHGSWGTDSVVSIGLDKFKRDGTVYAFWGRTVGAFKSLYGEEIELLPIPASETCNIDTPEDWAEAERRLKA